ncbi:MAG: dihydrofolate reductase [Prevotella sp.]|nr:dipeptidyl peptidase 3 [Prevotella sp.]MDD6817652.1 dihydrofolate reductase [Prevotellaceae bacterium]MDY5005384.1 dihydrofolate reductase [Prevotella sp.]MDY5124974.1 dihydrofolate reductase [Prevotella sp.]
MQNSDDFEYCNERFADLQMLRYKVDGFENLTLKQKTFIYYLQEAALWGRDILFDQNGKYNLEIRQTLEDLYANYKGDRESKDFKAFEVYLKRVWFSNGIHHHYGCEKFIPEFSREWFVEQTKCSDELAEIIFNPNIMAKRVNLADGQDLLLTSACNYYQGVTQKEAEEFYAREKANGDQQHPVMHGMNSTLVKGKDGKIYEERWTTTGKYGPYLTKIVENLKKARDYAEDEKQKEVIDKLVAFYETGDLKTFDEYSIAWVENTAPLVDFVNGFIECYGDPLGLKSSWESIVNFKDVEATKRAEKLSQNAQWFENNSPVDPKFKKDKVKGVSAKVIRAAILGGDLYPSTAIGINLPNSNWVRAEHGSKSVTIANLTHAYAQAAKGSGMMKEFAASQEYIDLMEKYGDLTDDLHTDLHECLGHGSGKLMPGVDPDSLKAYGSTIEEARADLFALYYLADSKLVEMGLLPDAEAYKASYIQQMMNGLLTQMVRIKLGDQIEESHMRNRALIARWAFEHGKGKGKDGKDVIEMVDRQGKTYVVINDFEALRNLFGQLLAEIQRIKSTGDFKGARDLVETYGVKIDPALHKQVLERYTKLNIAPYKGFINPVYKAVTDSKGNITDVTISYTEGYAEQMMRYSKQYHIAQ